ncbi:uncharacterized protein LOC127781982 [Oryza glaberrima]|uniref:uncharacterized protein LOC127781982 n=1 Tax=Oryza glaberrima TaxID=4538 RepID=UPI00224C06AE|nr:uncharacterized protein LOC127781982 [Oryza glaberrima]
MAEEGGSLAVGGGSDGWRGVGSGAGAAGLEDGGGPALGQRWWRGHLAADGSRRKKGGGGGEEAGRGSVAGTVDALRPAGKNAFPDRNAPGSSSSSIPRVKSSPATMASSTAVPPMPPCRRWSGAPVQLRSSRKDSGGDGADPANAHARGADGAAPGRRRLLVATAQPFVGARARRHRPALHRSPRSSPSTAPAATAQPSAGARAHAHRRHWRGWQGGQRPNRSRQGGIGGAAVELAMAAGEFFTHGMEEEEEPGAFLSGMVFWQRHSG